LKQFFSFYLFFCQIEMSQNRTVLSRIGIKPTKNALIAILILGLILNIICIIVFIKIRGKVKHYTGFMFKYLLIKSVNDFIHFLNKFIDTIVNDTLIDENKMAKNENFFKNWNVYFLFFLNNVFMGSSGYLDVAATLDCYVNITRKLKWLHKKRYFYIQLGLIYGSNCLLFSFYIIFQDYFMIFRSSNSQKGPYQTIKTIQNTLRDFVTGILLIFLNVIIFKYTRRSMKNKIHIQSISYSDYMTRISEKIRQTDVKQIQMISFICLNYTIGHMPIYIYTLSDLLIQNTISYLFYSITEIILFLSFLTPFFIYYFFNTFFSSFVNDKKKVLTRCVIRCS
jgi:hypothetical protein